MHKNPEQIWNTRRTCFCSTFDPAWRPRGSHVLALTRWAVSWVQRLKSWRWSSVCLPRFGSVFSGAHTPLHALSPLIQTHTCSHTIYSWVRNPRWRTLSLFLFEGGVQQRSGTGLFLVGVKLWPGLKAAAIRSPPWGRRWSGTPFEPPPAGRTSL